VELHGFTDASYTPEGDSRYLYRYALFLSLTAGAYSVKSKRSTTVSHSSAQSEIICDACKDVGPDREQLAALGFPQSRPTRRLCADSWCFPAKEAETPIGSFSQNCSEPKKGRISRRSYPPAIFCQFFAKFPCPLFPVACTRTARPASTSLLICSPCTPSADTLTAT
jgi:hypothetical protein